MVMPPWDAPTQDTPDRVKELLLGRTVVSVARQDDATGQVVLDDGTVLTVHGNEGCGGCGEGWYDITELNAMPNNVVMNVELAHVPYDDSYLERYQVFVLAEDTRIKVWEATGSDNGYYGTGYWLHVDRPQT